MARTIKIKPEFFLDADMAECSPYARLLFLGICCFSDKGGAIQNCPHKLKEEIFPFFGDIQISGVVGELVAAGVVTEDDEWIRISDPEKWLGRPGSSASVAAHATARRARKKRAMPAWADPEKIRLIYEEASELNRVTGIPHHVDHIVPLAGEGVCGLHWEKNLRVVTARENLKKGNKLDGGQQ